MFAGLQGNHESMCGIAAVLSRAAEGGFGAIAAHLTQALRHRGPDAQAHWSQRVSATTELLLVHTRLAILDLSPAGHQPMHDPETGNVIIFNGELYNFAELRSELVLHDPAYCYRSTGDTEVLLRGYARWGTDVLRKLDGIFAFVLFDARRRRLLIARDHLGIKPLYYSRHQGGWAFSSEVRALPAAGLCGRNLDSRAVADYLRLGAIQEPRTILAEVAAFPAGCYAEIDVDQPAILEPRRYWDARDALAARGDPERHRSVLNDTVDEQVVADVPVGVFLSAGIDSTALATLVAARKGNRLRAFTIASGAGSQNEAALAAETARHLGLPHSVFTLGGSESHRWVLDGLDAMDQPSSDGVNTYLVSRASREQGMVVALAGTGADELHGGYDHFYSLPRMRHWLANDLGRAVAPGILRLAGRKTDGDRLELMLARAPSMAAMLEEKRRFFTPDWIARCAPDHWSSRPEATTDAGADDQTEITLAELSGYLRNTLLRDSDWASMANAQELRVPYLGRRYIEFMLSLPWSAKGRRERINKPLLANLLPPPCREIIRRPKTGFSLDYAGLLLGPHRQAFIDAVEILNRHGFRLELGTLLAELESTRAAKSAVRLWALLSLGRYIERHLPSG